MMHPDHLWLIKRTVSLALGCYALNVVLRVIIRFFDWR